MTEIRAKKQFQKNNFSKPKKINVMNEVNVTPTPPWWIFPVGIAAMAAGVYFLKLWQKEKRDNPNADPVYKAVIVNQYLWSGMCLFFLGLMAIIVPIFQILSK
ncbi:MAG: hypothetical protein ABI199_00525 [Bacteroidia bacterium]